VIFDGNSGAPNPRGQTRMAAGGRGFLKRVKKRQEPGWISNWKTVAPAPMEGDHETFARRVETHTAWLRRLFMSPSAPSSLYGERYFRNVNHELQATLPPPVASSKRNFGTSRNTSVRLITAPPSCFNKTGQIMCYKSGQFMCSLQFKILFLTVWPVLCMVYPWSYQY
jgi:hypothetical protein